MRNQYIKTVIWKCFTFSFSYEKSMRLVTVGMDNTLNYIYFPLGSCPCRDKYALFQMLSSGPFPKEAEGGGQGWSSLLLQQREALSWKELLDKVHVVLAMRTLQT